MKGCCQKENASISALFLISGPDLGREPPKTLFAPGTGGANAEPLPNPSMRRCSDENPPAQTSGRPRTTPLADAL